MKCRHGMFWNLGTDRRFTTAFFHWTKLVQCCPFALPHSISIMNAVLSADGAEPWSSVIFSNWTIHTAFSQASCLLITPTDLISALSCYLSVCLSSQSWAACSLSQGPWLWSSQVPVGSGEVLIDSLLDLTLGPKNELLNQLIAVWLVWLTF